jgi:hypothetical protein
MFGDLFLVHIAGAERPNAPQAISDAPREDEEDMSPSCADAYRSKPLFDS